MIFLVKGRDVYPAFEQGAQLISWSAIGDLGLVRTETILTDIEILQECTEAESAALLSSPEWRQPCKDC